MRERLFRVHGRVQGVGFRWWTRSQARRLGVTGTVANLTDGSVEIRARAPDDVLLEFSRLLEQGPPGAAVTEVLETDTTGTSATAFDIVRTTE